MIAKIITHKQDVESAYESQIEKALMIIGMTAERYAVDICPKDTRRLANSISNVPYDDRSVIIGTNVEYAPYVELGTSRQKAQPYLRPAATDHVDEYTDIVKRVLKGEF